MSRRFVVFGRWLALFVAVTLFFAVAPELPELRIAHGVLVYLLLIVGASRENEQWLAALMVAAGYLAVDWFFVPPRRAFGVPSHLDIIILVGFLVTSVVISRLVFHLQRTAMEATARASEIERLSTERLRLELSAARADVLAEAERLKNALIASLTHDLRTPLATIALLADPDSPQPHAVQMRRIADETRRMARFVDTLRTFAFTSEQDATAVEVEAHVVDDLVGAAIQSREELLRGRRIQVQLPESPAIVMVRCDFTLTLQILANLIENAAKYSPMGSPVDIIVDQQGDDVEVAVADRGPGLASGDELAVFKPLRRGSSAVLANESLAMGGMGMGLSIARAFAHAQRGDLRYRPREGGGAMFVLVLPSAAVPSVELASP